MRKIFLGILFIYIIIAQNIFVKFSNYNNIINPFFWIIFTVFIYLFMPRKLHNKRKERKIVQYSIIATLFYIIIYMLSGLLVSFGKNPYSSHISGILMNIWVTALPIIGKEITRYYLVDSRKKLSDLYNIFIILTYLMIDFNFFQNIPQMTNSAIIFKLIVASLVPSTIKSIVYTRIVQNYTYRSVLIYEIVICIFLWVSPILSNVPWILSSIMDICIPVILLIYVNNAVDDEYRKIRNIRLEKRDPKSTIIFGGILLVATCFSVGLFPIHMKSIATGSMYPEIHVGDAVLVKKISINDLNVGDVIEYQIDNQYVIHRIIAKNQQDGIWVVNTKGDNNKAEDAKPVYEEQIQGKVIFKIKYVGLPAYYLHKIMNSNEKAVVETGN